MTTTDLNEIVALVDQGVAITREQAEFVVRSVTRVCKGPIKPGKEEEYAELRRAAGSFGGGMTGYDIGLVDSMNREGCGADFNDVICQFPFDGEEHFTACPKCGQEISFRSPFFNLVD